MLRVNSSTVLRYQNRAAPPGQRGAVLVVGLVTLTAMTILGIATLSGSRLGERITSNKQQKSLTFEVAESGIRSVWDVGLLRQTIVSNMNGQSNNPSPVVIDAAVTGLETAFDLLDDQNRGSDVNGQVTVQYCGEIAPLGSAMNEDLSTTQLASMMVDVNSVVQIANSGATSDHLQRLLITGPRTQRTANCTTR